MPLSLSETRALLSRLGVSPSRKLGQNFLVDTSVVDNSVQWAKIAPGGPVVEIGPGCGTLTAGLLQVGARVYAVEKDAAFYRHIRATYPVDIIHGDAVEMPVGHCPLDAPYKVVANLPYAIASVWLGKILEQTRLPECMVLLVQKEAAQRWLSPAGTKHFCALGIYLQSAYSCDQSRCVAKRSFFPQPQVDSTLMALEKLERPYIFPQPLKQWIRLLFTHRRQQLGHICRKMDSAYAQPFLSFLAKHSLSETLRPDALSPSFWMNFAQSLPEH